MLCYVMCSRVKYHVTMLPALCPQDPDPRHTRSTGKSIFLLQKNKNLLVITMRYVLQQPFRMHLYSIQTLGPFIILWYGCYDHYEGYVRYGCIWTFYDIFRTFLGHFGQFGRLGWLFQRNSSPR